VAKKTMAKMERDWVDRRGHFENRDKERGANLTKYFQTLNSKTGGHSRKVTSSYPLWGGTTVYPNRMKGGEGQPYVFLPPQGVHAVERAGTNFSRPFFEVDGCGERGGTCGNAVGDRK